MGGMVLGGLAIITFIIIILRGDKKLREREKVIEELTQEENTNLEMLGSLPYHGGFPQIPRPQKLNIALTHDSLLLFSDKGDSGKVELINCKKVEKFTTRKNPNLKGKSIVLWGPFVGLFSKPKFRHFIVIKYKDIRNENNNLLLEAHNINELDKVYTKIYNKFSKRIL